MIKNKVHLIIFLMVFSALFVQAEEKGTEVRSNEQVNRIKVGKQYFFLIGINHYTSPGWPDLTHPVQDIKEIRDILKNQYHVDNIIELYNNKATKAEIVRVFKSLQKELTVYDSLFIMYSGHGYFDTSSNIGFWIPSNAGADELEQANWLPNPQIRGLISNIEASHICLVSDSCFAGDILSVTKGGGIPDPSDIPYFDKVYRLTSRQVLTSGAMEPVSDASEFALQLKMALKKNTQIFLDPMTLHSQIKLGVTESIPLIGSLKDTGHQEGACFLLFLKTPEPEYGSIVMSIGADGKLYLDGMFYDDVTQGPFTIEDLESGEYRLMITYTSGETEEKTVTLKNGETTRVSFTFNPPEESGTAITPEPVVELDPTPKPEIVVDPFPKPETDEPRFTLALSGAYSMPVITGVADSMDNAVYVEASSTIAIIRTETLGFMLTAGGQCSFHPADNNATVLYAGIFGGPGISIPLGKSMGLLWSINSGFGFMKIDSDSFPKTLSQWGPSFGTSIEVSYHLAQGIYISIKGIYLTLMSYGPITEWIHEINTGASFGIRF